MFKMNQRQRACTSLKLSYSTFRCQMNVFLILCAVVELELCSSKFHCTTDHRLSCLDKGKFKSKIVQMKTFLELNKIINQIGIVVHVIRI